MVCQLCVYCVCCIDKAIITRAASLVGLGETFNPKGDVLVHALVDERDGFVVEDGVGLVSKVLVDCKAYL